MTTPAKARIDALTRENEAMKRALQAVRRDPFNTHVKTLDALDAELGSRAATTEITMEALKAGAFDAEELSTRLDEVRAVMSGKPVAGVPVTRADVLAMSAEEIADFGPEKALAIVNGDAA